MSYIRKDEINKNDLLTTRQVGKILGVTSRTVTRLVLVGELPNSIKAGSYINAPLLIPGASVIAYIESKE